jgi:hypothetical protein
MKNVLILFFIFGLLGCKDTPYINENVAYIVFKTPTFKYADMGFVYSNQNKIKLQIYSNAQSIMSLVVTKSNVCLSALKCMSSKQFNQKVLSKYYPDTILQNILSAKTIMNGKNKIQIKNGFKQKIVSQYYDISYQVEPKRILFEDKINHIKIKLISQ